MTVVDATSARIRFRRSGALWVAAVLFLVSGAPLALSAWYLTPVFLIPIGMAVWAWRSGVDVSGDGLTVKRVLGSRTVPWSRVDGFTTQGRTTYAVLDDGKAAIALPAVRKEDLPRLIDAGGAEFVTPEQAEKAQ